MSSVSLKLFGEKRFLYSVKVFPARIKSMKPKQKYPDITSSYACIVKMFALMFLFCEAEDKGRLADALISLGIHYTPKLSR